MSHNTILKHKNRPRVWRTTYGTMWFCVQIRFCVKGKADDIAAGQQRTYTQKNFRRMLLLVLFGFICSSQLFLVQSNVVVASGRYEWRNWLSISVVYFHWLRAIRWLYLTYTLKHLTGTHLRRHCGRQKYSTGCGRLTEMRSLVPPENYN